MALMVLAALRDFPSGVPIPLCQAGPAAPEAGMCEYASVAQVDAHRIDADQTGVARVSHAQRDCRETAGYSRSHVAGMAARALKRTDITCD